MNDYEAWVAAHLPQSWEDECRVRRIIADEATIAAWRHERGAEALYASVRPAAAPTPTGGGPDAAVASTGPSGPGRGVSPRADGTSLVPGCVPSVCVGAIVDVLLTTIPTKDPEVHP